MTRYFAQRLLHGVALLFLISGVSFLLFQLAPGNYTDAIRLDPRVSPETAAMLRARYGLNRPLPWQYLAWVKSVLRGELGFSFGYGLPVGTLIWPRVANTLLLTVSAAVFAWPAALLIGIAAAVSRHQAVRRVTTLSMSVLVSLPELLVALLLMMLALRTRVFPIVGMNTASTSGGGFATIAAHLALPATALVVVTLPVLARHIEAALREALLSASLQAARAHGLPRSRILLAYAVPAAANPLISLFGLSIGTLLSASLAIEVVMGWPGLGPLVLEAVLSRDTPIVLAATLLSGALFISGNLVSDLLLYAVDPRIREISRTP
jgi:peptide/nickel transport system permease protein